jgi:hypothetical protein
MLDDNTLTFYLNDPSLGQCVPHTIYPLLEGGTDFMLGYVISHLSDLRLHRIAQVSASSCCDYPPAYLRSRVETHRQGHIGQGHIG